MPTCSSKREQSKVAANLERRQIGEQFMVLDQARLPEKPFSPNRPLFLLVGLAAGFGLGALIAGWLEFRDTTLRSEADIVATLQLPLLVLVPDIHTKSERRWRRFRVAVWSVGATTLFVARGLPRMEVRRNRDLRVSCGTDVGKSDQACEG